MIKINDIAHAMAYLEETVRKNGEKMEAGSAELRAELSGQNKHFAVMHEIMRLFLDNPETALVMCSRTKNGGT